MESMTNPDPLDNGTDVATTDLGEWVAGLANLVDRGMAKEVAPYGISPTEFNLLRFCLYADGETTATQLAGMLPIDASRISRVVTTLVDRGLLRRRRLREDRRVVMLRLSPEGSDLIVRACESMNAFAARLMRGISEDDVRVIRSVFDRMIVNHAAMEGSGGGGGGSSPRAHPASSPTETFA